MQAVAKKYSLDPTIDEDLDKIYTLMEEENELRQSMVSFRAYEYRHKMIRRVRLFRATIFLIIFYILYSIYHYICRELRIF